MYVFVSLYYYLLFSLLSIDMKIIYIMIEAYEESVSKVK